jgi:hypothetical protein
LQGKSWPHRLEGPHHAGARKETRHLVIPFTDRCRSYWHQRRQRKWEGREKSRSEEGVPEDLRDLIQRGDRASRASQDAECLYIEAGRKLASLKTQYAIRKAEKRVTLRWAAFVKARVGVSKSRANELIQMAGS